MNKLQKINNARRILMNNDLKRKLRSIFLTTCTLTSFAFHNAGILTYASEGESEVYKHNISEQMVLTNEPQEETLGGEKRLHSEDLEDASTSEIAPKSKRSRLDVKSDDSLIETTPEEKVLINKIHHDRHLKGIDLKNLTDEILKSMGKGKSKDYNKWCLSVLIRIYKDEKRAEQDIIKAYKICDEIECFNINSDSDMNLLYRAINLLSDEHLTRENQEIINIVEKIKNRYIGILNVDNLKREKFSKYQDYYRLNIIRVLFLCSKECGILDEKIIKDCYNAIDINLLKGDSVALREALLVYAKFGYDIEKGLKALKILLAGKSYEEAAKGDEISREALLQIGKIPHGNGEDSLEALKALIGGKPYEEAAKGDEILREALLQIGKIPHGNGEDSLRALKALIGRRTYEEASKGDEISRKALLQIGKIPHGSGEDELAALYALCDYISRGDHRLLARYKRDDLYHVRYYYSVLRNGGNFGVDIIETMTRVKRDYEFRGKLNAALVIYTEQKIEKEPRGSKLRRNYERKIGIYEKYLGRFRAKIGDLRRYI